MMETAQDRFKRHLRDDIAPALRREGLRGSGTSYVLPNPTVWAQVGFQKSMSSSTDVVRFTINLKVTDKASWDEQRRDHSAVKDTPPLGIDPDAWNARRLEESYYPPRPAANTLGYGRYKRIGQLLPSPGDQWWDLTVDNADEVIGIALHALLTYGLPWLRREVGPT